MRSYEQLVGAEGRRIFFRAERFKAKDLLSPKLIVLEVENRPLKLVDFSMSGVAALDLPQSDWTDRLGETVELRLSVGPEVAHAGRGRIARVEPTVLGPKLGLQFIGGYLDVAELLARQEEVSLRQELDVGLEREVERICPGYRLLCADVLFFLRRFRATLERLDVRPSMPGGRNRDRATEILDYCEERGLPDWRQLWRRGNALVAPIMQDAEKLRAVKRFTELVLTPELMEAPIWRRSYEKPLGYPGDYLVMKQVYEWARAGETLYGRFVHRLGLEVAECIATRMTMVKQAIAETVAEQPCGGTVHVMSLGCGPAQEVANFLEAPHLLRPVKFTLIDQDEHALALAYSQAFPEVLRHGGDTAVTCLQVSFTQLLKAWSILGEVPKQDLIYSVGLIDYLATRRVRPLVTTLYEQLKPGGRLIVGNMREMPGSNLWPMEFLCDWSVIYRDEADMHALIEDLSPAPVIEALEPDPTGRVLMFYLRRPTD